MLKKVKENKKLEIIQKINTFTAFCVINKNNFEKENELFIGKKNYSVSPLYGDNIYAPSIPPKSISV